jgi:hypothetical protein
VLLTITISSIANDHPPSIAVKEGFWSTAKHATRSFLINPTPKLSRVSEKCHMGVIEWTLITQMGNYTIQAREGSDNGWFYCSGRSRRCPCTPLFVLLLIVFFPQKKGCYCSALKRARRTQHESHHDSTGACFASRTYTSTLRRFSCPTPLTTSQTARPLKSDIKMAPPAHIFSLVARQNATLDDGSVIPSCVTDW